MHRVLVSGVPQEYVSVQNRGLHYGDGLFETIKIEKGKLFRWTRHVNRLQASCQRLGMLMPKEELLYQEAQQCAAGLEIGMVKILLTRGWHGRGYAGQWDEEAQRIVMAQAYEPPNEQAYMKGWKMKLCKTRLSVNPSLAGLKHLGRLEQVLGRAELQDHDEGLMLDTQGQIIEATSANVFFVQHKILYSPSLESCGVRGVMRDEILDLAKQLDIECCNRSILPCEIPEFSEVFICNSLIGIMPIRQIENQIYKMGRLTQKLKEELHA